MNIIPLKLMVGGIFMRKPKQIYDEVYKELLDEFGIENIKEKPQTLDEIENMMARFGKEFERRVIEKTTMEQREDIDKKKAVKNATHDSRTSGYEKKK